MINLQEDRTPIRPSRIPTMIPPPVLEVTPKNNWLNPKNILIGFVLIFCISMSSIIPFILYDKTQKQLEKIQEQEIKIEKCFNNSTQQLEEIKMLGDKINKLYVTIAEREKEIGFKNEEIKQLLKYLKHKRKQTKD